MKDGYVPYMTDGGTFGIFCAVLIFDCHISDQPVSTLYRFDDNPMLVVFLKNPFPIS